MQYEKKELIAEGKTKRVWATQNDRLVIVEFKDDALNYHGKKHVFFHGKGALSNPDKRLSAKIAGRKRNTDAL